MLVSIGGDRFFLLGGETPTICLFSPRTLGKMNPHVTVAYFSNGLVKNHQLAKFVFEEGGKLMYLTYFVSSFSIFWLVNS